ncbi:MAG TPA: ATP-dependent DNA helicase RecG [Marmoricola sp.]|nr:ATP-dependent DNA helicase RecG [Marmoricola sp.]
MISWDSKVAAVGGKEAKKAEKLGLLTVGDLLQHYPRRYIRKGDIDDPGSLREGDHVTILGRIAVSEQKTWLDRRTRRTAWRQEVVVDTGTTRMALTFFDRQQRTADWRAKKLAVGRYGLFSGLLGRWRNDWQLTNPDTKVFPTADEIDEAVSAQPELIPVYPASSTVQSWDLQETIRLALVVVEDVPDVLPDAVREAEDLVDVSTAYRWIHQPESWAQVGAARKRLKYDEAFVTQAVLARRRLALRDTVASPRTGRHDGLLDRFDERLPFELTAGQREVGDEVLAELGRGHPMHRLLQGEVGSGKTVVALRAMLRVVDSGGQAALLAPTEVLAQQHHRTITTMLGDLARPGELGGDAEGTRVALLTGSLGASARKQAMLEVTSGEAGIVVGTHALLEERVEFFDLGLVVVDEQHRFGVEQRAALAAKADTPPHVLVMTATPIPRTVAMTVFGDLDTSTLRELPAGRAEVSTVVVPEQAPGWLDRAWQRIREEVDRGRQGYVVCPRISADEKPDAGDTEMPDRDDEDATPRRLHAVEQLTPELAQGPLQGLRVAALHGRMTPEEKDGVMREFASGTVDVLVSTTVIEVGVDVPNASVMVIMDADRFGVSQLHQLRGRIGRGGHEGLCLLVTGAEPGSPSHERLAAVAATRDGFELSRVDLAQRREGDVLGRAQSGRHSTLKMLSVLNDEEVIARARTAAADHLDRDPELGEVPDLAGAVRALEESESADFLEMG